MIPLDPDTQRQVRLARLLVSPYLDGTCRDREEHLAGSLAQARPVPFSRGQELDTDFGLFTDAGGARRFVYRPTSWDALPAAATPASPAASAYSAAAAAAAAPTSSAQLVAEEARDMLAAQQALYASLSSLATDLLQHLLAATVPEYAHCLPMLAREGSLLQPLGAGAASQTSLTALFTPPEAEWAALLPFQQREAPGAAESSAATAAAATAAAASPAARAPPPPSSSSRQVLTLSSRPERASASASASDCSLITLVVLPGDDARLELQLPGGSGEHVNPLAYTSSHNAHTLVAVAFPGQLLDAALNASKYALLQPPRTVCLATRQRLRGGAAQGAGGAGGRGSASALLHVLRLQPPPSSDLNLQRILALACGASDVSVWNGPLGFTSTPSTHTGLTRSYSHSTLPSHSHAHTHTLAV